MQREIDSLGFPAKQILGIRISVVDLSQLLQAIDGLVQRGRPALVNNVNVHACNLAYEQPAFREVLNHSEVVFCDGFGVKLAGCITGNRLGQRMTPPDWIDALFALCVRKNYSVYFLGDTDEVVGLFAEKVLVNHPALRIAGQHHGFFDLQGAENDRVIQAIVASGADIVITGMGMPRQELWAWDAKGRLDKGVVIAAGALFRWYTGYEQRAPKWITGCGLEWLARLISRPRRNFKRYVVGLPLFYWRVLRSPWAMGGDSNHG
ncbi:MAG: WecB/TagA/CpsF family glycosyltransferase [Kiritimatiellales bacterium]|nr:WecB/TagA/CpsF family glycosyltransferase [Kiritimatiellales bacterium]